MKNISDKLKVLSVALNERGLDSYASEVEELYNEVDLKSEGFVRQGNLIYALKKEAIEAPAAVAGGAAVGGAAAGVAAGVAGGASVGGGMAGLAAGCTVISGGICGIAIGAGMLLGGGFVWDWWNDNHNYVERIGGDDSMTPDELYEKWKEYFRDFDLIRGNGSFPAIDSDKNIGGQQDRRVERFFEEFDELYANTSNISEDQLENLVAEHYDGNIGWTSWFTGTFGLDDEEFFVNCFNAIVDGKRSMQKEVEGRVEEDSEEEMVASGRETPGEEIEHDDIDYSIVNNNNDDETGFDEITH